ncbi:MAG: dehydrogenase [Hyphomicrobiales bacterium]|nr:SDR family oxidoreductase [Hyphomicrobiales bacterium]PCJ86580.1 MAG: dehydrogenase [Hyphomicrobiales bacterium]
MSLQDKSAIVTGGARGIGLACAKLFLERGAKVIIADIDEKAGNEAEKNLSAIGQVQFVHCDVSDRLSVRNLMASSLDAYGQVDILINNAGVIHTDDFLDISEDDFNRVLSVNLKGAFLCGQAAARHMVERVKEGGSVGSIINMSSVNSQVAISNQVPYSVSKGGIQQLTKVMALSLAPYGIRVNAIGPGSINTDILAAVNDDPAAKHKLLSRTPLGRIGEPSEIASIAAFLATSEAGYITGQTLFADGGRLALNYIVPVAED